MRPGRLLKLVSIATLVIGLAGTVFSESYHYYRFRHLVGYGTHFDILLADSSLGTADFYDARVWNVSLRTLDVEGCRMPGGYVGDGILYRWDVQKWNQKTEQWNSLNGADTWEPVAFGVPAHDGLEGCRGEMTHIRPFSTQVLGWVFKSWVTTGEPVRIAIHTSVTRPPIQQRILYTDMFVVRRF